VHSFEKEHMILLYLLFVSFIVHAYGEKEKQKISTNTLFLADAVFV